MSQRTATITSLPVAFEVVKAMQADGLDWGEGFRPLGRQALGEIIEDQMALAVDRYLEQIEADDPADRRNGHYRRNLLTELGDIELHVPRTRRYSPTEVIRAYARRTREIDRVILAGFVLGLSTRKVGETLLALLGRKVSASTVSQVAKTLDAAVAAFHRRPLQNRYKALMLDGVVLARKTSAGALRRPVLVALGLRPDGKKALDTEVISKIREVQNLELVLVTGHTDRIGTQAYNQKLSERRANAVRDYLVSQGVARDKIETLGMGKTQPVPGVVCNQPYPKERKALIECLAPNRRVEVEVKGEIIKVKQ